ncbi:heavy metal translocating P-type ATPase [Prevotella lacticifex]|uniref:P-type Zn(2+) transporter n=1 Tax=Prevotella lacticifex TaxID=2854755 RepID=A0A9R1CXJ9_9BACT|nr:heavy metal translocating P-type ATPase [Prevotella lacticifex]GJG38352.1 hypothetical protein PRLR5019_03230 [Prevotella lacticifex]GJG44709.1 hypothetical protein PRLR5027_03040 [Prevotella lacticifex]GJG59842.1 hypothetical protein PRLR5076_26930 [Prevotella lacticifex]GJG60594.1 hypothetical protein PRLR5107_02540 [Prevotella lacticifex]
MNKKVIRIIVTAVLLLAAWLTTSNLGLSVWASFAIFLIPYLLISYDVLGEAWEGIEAKDPFNEDFLMSVATIGAMLIGFVPGAEAQFPEAVFVMLFFQIGEVFEDYAEDNSRRSISHLMDIRPDRATVLRCPSGNTKAEEISVDPKDIKIGETIVVRPGEKIPLDGTVTDGDASLDTTALTGESMPRSVHKGDTVTSGCVSTNGVLKIRVEKTFGESTASKIISLVEESSKNKSKSETFIRKFAHIYTPVVVFAAIALAVVPPLIAGGGWAQWIYRALTFLVVSCPCALVISVPLTFFAGIGGASRIGVLVKGGNYMDVLAKVSTMVFDKTGTLTRGLFVVEDVHSEKYSFGDLLHLVAHVEQYSNHPIASALRNVKRDWHDDCRVENVHEIAGNGVEGYVNGRKVSVGNEKMMKSLGITISECPRCRGFIGTVVHVAVDGVYAGHIVIADQIKDDAPKTIRDLKALGVDKTVMLTGDREVIAADTARKIGIDEYHSELLPADKVRYVEELLKTKTKGRTLAFVGDGINDAPVLARADIGIAMGGVGSDAAIEAADVVIMNDRPLKIVRAIKIARRTIRIARENAWFAIAVKVAILILAATGLLGSLAMALAVFGDVGVMILCVLNAMRALQTKKFDVKKFEH